MAIISNQTHKTKELNKFGRRKSRQKNNGRGGEMSQVTPHGTDNERCLVFGAKQLQVRLLHYTF